MKRFKYLTLAALVAIAACESAEEPVVAPTPTGTISGVVTIEGVGAAGIDVTLSSGTSVTTDASGAFLFSDVPAGAYTVSISGFASDASFSPIAKSASIATTGQVATVNFDGNYVRTASIFGSVAGAGAGLSGVTVHLGDATTTTDENGRYSFSDLRAGTYTVTIAGWDPTTYAFATASLSVTVGVGEAKAADFTGALMTNASISGSIFIDENNQDNVFTPALEEKLTVAGLAVGLEVEPSDTIWTVTDANGDYSFTDLVPGRYTVVFGNPAGVFATPASAVLPAMLAANGPNVVASVLADADGAMVNFPVDIATQAVMVSGFLGTDADIATTPGPGIEAISGWTVNLYDTQTNAAVGGATGRLATGKTGTDGNITFRFARANDIAPNAATSDQVVFAQVGGAPSATHAMSGETIIEIKYAANDSMVMAPDTFDATYGAAVVGIRAEEIDGDALAAWQAVLRSNKDTTKATVMSGATAANGWIFFNITPANLVSGLNGSDGALPDTINMRLSTTQAGANGHGFTQTPVADEGMVNGGNLRFIWDGTTSPNDTIFLGASQIKYTDVNVLFGVHHEKDDSTDVATFTMGDATASVGAGSVVQLYSVASNGTKTAASAAVAPGSAGAPWKAWERPMFNLPVANTWEIRARTVDGNLDVLADTAITFMLEGDDQTDTIAPLMGGGGVSTFALKANNTGITGTILSVDGTTPVASQRVMITATSDNIQPNSRGTDSTVVKTNAAGVYTMTGMREGPYNVMVVDSAGVWSYMTTLKTTTQKVNTAVATVPVAGTEKGGNPVANADAHNAVRDNQGYASTSVANFAAHRMDTKVQGVVVNDRDSDFNTLDPDEALSGVTIELYDDADADGVVDAAETVTATTTTDATGAYGFSGLKEDNYIVKATSPANATVLRALSATGAVTSTAKVLTQAAPGATVCGVPWCSLNQNLTRQVGNMDPPAQMDELPRWSYTAGTAAADGGTLGAGPNSTNTNLTTAPTHFVHLFNTGTVTGTVKAGATGVAGVRATITRCQTSGTAPSPPAAGACTAKHGTPSPHIKNTDTDANGKYTFTGLLEGVYQVDVAPATAGYTNIVTPGAGSYLATLQGNNDVETVPDFTIS